MHIELGVLELTLLGLYAIIAVATTVIWFADAADTPHQYTAEQRTIRYALRVGATWPVAVFRAVQRNW